MIRILCLVLLLILAPTQPARAQKPNIVVVLFDDMGYAEPASFNKASKFQMPHFDKLASQGMRFTDAHSPSSVCTPTRYGLLTGRYPWRIGQFGVLGPWGNPVIPTSRMTVASMLHDAGYHTACVGKWHLGMTLESAEAAKDEEKGKGEGKGKKQKDAGKNATADASIAEGAPIRNAPTTRGFDYFTGYNAARGIGLIVVNDKFDRAYKDVEVQPLLAQRAVNYIEARAKDSKPFFLYVPLATPHTPHVPSADFKGKTGLGDHGDWLMEGDWALGQVLAALERTRLDANTLVIVTSDNGSPHVANTPLRGKKAQIWEGGHRVPFIARWPEKIRPGSVSDERISHVDIMATAAEVAGIKLPDNAGEDSVSLVPTLRGQKRETVPREAIVAQSMAGDIAIMHGPWKLIYHKQADKAFTQELYSIKDDLAESKDVAAANPQVVDKMAALMERYIREGRSTAGTRQKNEYELRLGLPSQPSK